MNVLVVDDSAVMRTMIVRMLRLSGIALDGVFEASNGVEGLDALGKHTVDLALVDLNMPVMSGGEMIDRVRADRRLGGVRLVVVSTDRSPGQEASLRALGADFVHKPFTPEVLRSTILRATGAER